MKKCKQLYASFFVGVWRGGILVNYLAWTSCMGQIPNRSIIFTVWAPEQFQSITCDVFSCVGLSVPLPCKIFKVLLPLWFHSTLKDVGGPAKVLFFLRKAERTILTSRVVVT